ncbi:MAG: hypothetical protein UU77_C0005G0022 [candidate division WWE3 bacterium GW2011_GWC1_41_7]|uniref:HMA domain-containing protein n=3 Tax=Katanobacteria TaxID=422282 RepID=A0A0G0X8B7_UNCKA|nr:MAG: hypothetical protein UU77_C0005G0022 [candidate division WWE3 bacterium GW2011_GWC1_41_7]KKS22721.1 MAG: hypothetical protein UU80_C0003G0021 [candidate division WWE3 bacterium GW2011_GWA1_41_8]OGC57720.1 MAG: hypothetical protein A2976_02160 [candidate division WWE3 bacterium RIFCSPLOWO2_01_FULL_41_9]
MKNVSQGKFKRTYYIKGMHCSSCETLVEKEVASHKGVCDVRAKVGSGKVEILAEDSKSVPGLDHLNKTFKDAGYTFSANPITQKTLNTKDFAKITVFTILFIISFLYIQRSGLFLRMSVNETSSYATFFVFGLAAGFSSCAALVGGLLLSLSKQWNEIYGGNSKKSFTPFILFNLGRILSFLVFGGLLGVVGSFFRFSQVSTAALAIFISLIMFTLGLQMIGVGWAQKIRLRMPKSLTNYVADETKFKGKYMPFTVGALTFFLPCGFTLMAQTSALASGSFVTSSIMLLAFVLGTLPVLALISFSSVKLLNNSKASARFSLFSGVLVAFFALYTLNSQLNLLGFKSLSDIKIRPLSLARSVDKKVLGSKQIAANDIQYLQMEAAGFEYYPKKATLKAGVPVVWEFYNSGVYGCGQSVSARGLYPGIVTLKPGMNTFKFTPKAGTYKITCSMGMVDPAIITVR